MDDAEIDALDEGRELDRLIASAIGRDECEAQLNGFRPSSDWNDAMRAVEKFFGSTQVNVAHVGRNGGDTPWHVWVDEVPCIETQAESGPLAICRAILKVVKK